MRRIAMIGHGDYAAAVSLIGRGEPEPYHGMAYTLQVLRSLFGDDPHLVISLDAPLSREVHGEGEWVGQPRTELPHPVPKTVAMILWARRVVHELERFRPTHVLLRTGGILAWHVLRYSIAHRLDTLVMFASTFDEPDPKSRFVNRRLAKLLNHPCVFLAGNHKSAATTSMVRFGVEQQKAVAWDWPAAKHPKDWPTKRLDVGEPWRLLYVGLVLEAKGVGDLVDAVKILHDRGHAVLLTVAGDGPDLDRMRDRGRALPSGIARFTGRVGNEEAFRLMLESALVCVPSRPEYSEGMPLTLTEALASRTPVIISDHPALTRTFADGVGLRYFEARAPMSLAKTIEEVLSSPEEYSALSRSTAKAYAQVECSTTFGDVIGRWRNTFLGEDRIRRA